MRSLTAWWFVLMLAACGAASSGSDGGRDGAGGDGGGPATDGGGDGPVAAVGLHTAGNHLRTADGAIWHGRGANVHDTRSCEACTAFAPSVAEVNRRIDALVDDWGANFVRLDLESYRDAGGFRVHWGGPLEDAGYLADLVAIVDHIGTKPGVYVLLSLWIHPSFTSVGWPSAETRAVWTQLATTFADRPHVLFGLVNEPEFNFDGAQDAAAWTAMNDTVAAIRAAEVAAGGLTHVVAVQGTGAWARRLGYYVSHPITAGGGANVAYEVHVYDPASEFDGLFVQPAATLPVIIGEFGPANMTLDDTAALMAQAEALEVPYLAWTFHMRCPPNLLVDNSGGACGVGMPLEPTAWGRQLKDRLAQPF